MKALLLIVIGYCLRLGYSHFTQQGAVAYSGAAYVTVYGRNSCGYTQRALRELEAAGIQFNYLSVDDSSSADVLHEKMRQQDISTRRYLLPVIDTNGELSVRPDTPSVIAAYHSFEPSR